MNFKTWITLNESVQIINEYSKTHQIVNLGKLGWWTVFSAVKSNKPSIITSAQYRQLLPSGRVQEDYLVDMVNSHLAKYFTEASYSLSKVGFPKMHTVALIVDLTDKVNHITGGDIGGYADKTKHGITISRSHIETNIIVHEHAHMYWFNLPKPNKKFFQDYYYKNITRAKIPVEQKWKLNPLKFDVKKLDKIIDDNWHNFYEDLVILNPIAERYFDFAKAKENNNQQATIEASVMPRRGYYCNAILKIPLEVSASYSSSITLKPGTVVLVENVGKYIINWRNNDKRYEHQTSIEYKDLFNFVEFKIDVLSEDQLKRYKELQPILKATASQVFAPNSQKEKIDHLFDKVAERISDWFVYGRSGWGGKENSSGFDKDQMFYINKLKYSNWVAVIGRRFKNGKIMDVSGLKQAYLDIFKGAIVKGFEKGMPKHLHHNDFPQIDMGKPEVSPYRDYIHSQGIVASPYGAANIDELWATSVEHAVKGQTPPQLVKLIYKTINGF